MKTTNIKYLFIIAFAVFLFGCDHSGHDHSHEEEHSSETHHEEAEHREEVHFSEQQFQSLKMKVDSLPYRNLSSYVEANGDLEVPPQNEAAVTAIIGANIVSIKVIEGDKVKKGQALAYLSHPDLIRLQTEFIQAHSRLQFLEKEFNRQKTLYEEKVGSGKNLQKTEADYLAMKGQAKGLEAQLRLLALNIEKIKQGEIYEQVSVLSPIDGHIRAVEVKTGQFVEPQKEMFEIVNIAHIHADLMVFEKDMHKIKEGQKINFTIESLPDEELEATIYSVGKAFEQAPKAIHLHAEIENKKGLLLPGMYVRGRIMVEDVKNHALPEEGVVREGDKYFIFIAEKEAGEETSEWTFKPVEVITGTHDDGWVEIKLLNPLAQGSKIAWNNAYYLLAEMKKGEAGHEH